MGRWRAPGGSARQRTHLAIERVPLRMPRVARSHDRWQLPRLTVAPWKAPPAPRRQDAAIRRRPRSAAPAPAGAASRIRRRIQPSKRSRPDGAAGPAPVGAGWRLTPRRPREQRRRRPLRAEWHRSSPAAPDRPGPRGGGQIPVGPHRPDPARDACRAHRCRSCPWLLDRRSRPGLPSASHVHDHRYPTSQSPIPLGVRSRPTGGGPHLAQVPLTLGISAAVPAVSTGRVPPRQASPGRTDAPLLQQEVRAARRAPGGAERGAAARSVGQRRGLAPSRRVPDDNSHRNGR